MPVPDPTPIYRIVHVDTLAAYLQRGRIHAPNHCPDDGLAYKAIHNPAVQSKRGDLRVECGPGGTLHDYVPFYFGRRSVMLLNLHTGRVPEYEEGQGPIVYLVATAQAVAESGAEFVFSDGHGLAAFTEWFDGLGDLESVDWTIVNARYWSNTEEDNDRQRRKQAEFLVHHSCDLALVGQIHVLDDARKTQVEALLDTFGGGSDSIDVVVTPQWYYS